MNRRQGIGLALFCLIGGSGWLLDNALPPALPIFERTSLHYFVVSLIVVAMLIARRTPVQMQTFAALRLALAGFLLLGLPELLNEVAHATTAETQVALFALVPLFVIVLAASLHRDATGSTRGRALMMPALIGFSGALLVLPFRFPSANAGIFSFSLVFFAVLSTAFGSVRIATLLRECPVLFATAIVCGINALAFGLIALGQGIVVPAAGELLAELLRSVFFDLPLLLLLLWLLRELPPVRLATRFLLIPLLSAIEASAVLRSPVDLRMGAGMLLMATGSTIILFWRGAAEEDRATILGLN
ncbi:DMT family transporter [Granulicella arctica]|uniref:DMT family transporter n=1 Tax=Granulicella arctica TaxID=940613 RepID=UPI0021DF932D|nr:DMT family transporter [Granulicella arctica]